MYPQPKSMHWRTGDTLPEHVALIRRQIEVGLSDPSTRMLAGAIVSGNFDSMQDPRTGVAVPVVPYHGRWYRGALDWAAARQVCGMRDYTCEVTAIWNFLVLNLRYTQDQAGEDTYQSLRASLEIGAGDCFPRGTLLLRDDYSLLPVEALRAGDRIWGEKDWSTVEAVGPKGTLPLTGIRLNNGAWVRLTEDHKVYVLTCPRHAARVSSGPCSCAAHLCEVERIRVADLQPGMRMMQPERIAFGADDTDPDRHLLEGLYLSDGWTEGRRFSISGKDGCVKEAQKREVEAICARLGIPTRWHERYITVNDPAWAARMALMGGHAPEKRALSLNLGEAQAAALLRGIMADSGANTHGQGRTFTTTSRELAVQTRVLHRMFGRSCGSSYIENHGGLGTHPIWRMNVRGAGARADKVLRVKEIVRDLPAEPVWDIQTSDHKVYLPEYDVTVSNCDDMTIAFATLLKAVGFETVYARIVSMQGETWDHIYPIVVLPNGKRLVLDATEKGKVPGWEYRWSAAKEDFAL